MPILLLTYKKSRRTNVVRRVTQNYPEIIIRRGITTVLDPRQRYSYLSSDPIKLMPGGRTWSSISIYPAPNDCPIVIIIIIVLLLLGTEFLFGH